MTALVGQADYLYNKWLLFSLIKKNGIKSFPLIPLNPFNRGSDYLHHKPESIPMNVHDLDLIIIL